MCKKCNYRTYFRIIDQDDIKYFACNCLENMNIIEKRENIIVEGMNVRTGELSYKEIQQEKLSK